MLLSSSQAMMATAADVLNIFEAESPAAVDRSGLLEFVDGGGEPKLTTTSSVAPQFCFRFLLLFFVWFWFWRLFKMKIVSYVIFTNTVYAILRYLLEVNLERPE